jgi:uncharacterized membrane protein
MKNLNTWRIFLVLSYLSYLINNAYLYILIETELSISSSLVVIFLKILPLLVFLPWLIKPNYKASLFFCLLLMLYFAFSAISMFEDGIRGYIALLNGLIICGLFVSSFMLGKLHKE